LKPIEIKPDVYWIGGIDWDLRDFHGYTTQRGSTYNSYLIIDEEITIIDTVKHYLFDEMLKRMKTLIDPKDIKFIISNHVEMDHSGSLPSLLDHAPNAKIITSTKGEKGLNRHFKKNWDLQVVPSGDTLNIGKRTLNFVHVPMVHWPDSMVTYSPLDKILFSNDAFGQHIASIQRFDDDLEWGLLLEEAAKYYSNIVMPYGSQVKKALDQLSDLNIEIISPSHGIIWRSYIEQIIENYKKWCQNHSDNKALIIYDTMWGSTQKIAYKLFEGIEETGVPISIMNLRANHISDIIKEILYSKLILIGSPTLNNTMLPTMGGFLTYLKGLKPQNRIGFVFGSFGWSGQAVGEIEKTLSDLSWELPEKSVNINYIPDRQELSEIKNIGKKLGTLLKKR
jgi:flavorubredoxin